MGPALRASDSGALGDTGDLDEAADGWADTDSDRLDRSIASDGVDDVAPALQTSKSVLPAARHRCCGIGVFVVDGHVAGGIEAESDERRFQLCDVATDVAG